MPDLEKHFNDEAEEFDKRIHKNIPCYEEMIEVLVNAIPDNQENLKVLDLGCGTGNISKKILERFPEAKVTCFDFSENMLKIAEYKLADYDVEYVKGDFTKLELTDKYDAIISSLALHHIETDEEKEDVYKQIYDLLENSGVFINADVIQANSKYNAELNNKVAFEDMKKNGLTDEEIEEHRIKRHENDIPATMINHLKMLENVGFQEIDVIWKYFANAVYGATKIE